MDEGEREGEGAHDHVGEEGETRPPLPPAPSQGAGNPEHAIEPTQAPPAPHASGDSCKAADMPASAAVALKAHPQDLKGDEASIRKQLRIAELQFEAKRLLPGSSSRSVYDIMLSFLLCCYCLFSWVWQFGSLGCR